MKQLAALLRLPHLLALVLLAVLANGGKVYAQNNSFDEIPLNGIASFVKLRKEHYIGGLYLETLSQDSGSVFNFSGRKRMDIRITIDRWSPRSFTQQWNQSILINNDQDIQQQFADQIYAFTDMLSDDLVAGDRITIDMVPDVGTTVSVNGVVLMSETDNAFFDLLLNSWIGRRPPSSDFRNDILTLPSDAAGEALVARYNAVQADSARNKVIAKWKKPDSPSPIAQVAKAVPEDKPKPEPKVAAAPPETPAADVDDRAVAEAALETAPKAIATSVAAAPAVSKPAISAAASAPPKAATKPQVAIEKPKIQVAVAKPKPKTEAKPAPKPEEKPVTNAAAATQEPEKVALSAVEQEQKKLLRKYQRTVLKLTYLNTQYPKRAMDLNQQGLLRVAVKIDRQGKVLDIVEQVSSKHKLLNKAARDAVNKTAPYPEAPEGLIGNDFEIVLPFNFKL